MLMCKIPDIEEMKESKELDSISKSTNMEPISCNSKIKLSQKQTSPQTDNDPDYFTAKPTDKITKRPSISRGTAMQNEGSLFHDKRQNTLGTEHETLKNTVKNTHPKVDKDHKRIENQDISSKGQEPTCFQKKARLRTEIDTNYLPAKISIHSRENWTRDREHLRRLLESEEPNPKKQKSVPTEHDLKKRGWHSSSTHQSMQRIQKQVSSEEVDSKNQKSAQSETDLNYFTLNNNSSKTLFEQQRNVRTDQDLNNNRDSCSACGNNSDAEKEDIKGTRKRSSLENQHSERMQFSQTEKSSPIGDMVQNSPDFKNMANRTPAESEKGKKKAQDWQHSLNFRSGRSAINKQQNEIKIKPSSSNDQKRHWLFKMRESAQTKKNLKYLIAKRTHQSMQCQSEFKCVSSSNQTEKDLKSFSIKKNVQVQPCSPSLKSSDIGNERNRIKRQHFSLGEQSFEKRKPALTATGNEKGDLKRKLSLLKDQFSAKQTEQSLQCSADLEDGEIDEKHCQILSNSQVNRVFKKRKTALAAKEPNNFTVSCCSDSNSTGITDDPIQTKNTKLSLEEQDPLLSERRKTLATIFNQKKPVQIDQNLQCSFDLEDGEIDEKQCQISLHSQVHRVLKKRQLAPAAKDLNNFTVNCSLDSNSNESNDEPIKTEKTQLLLKEHQPVISKRQETLKTESSFNNFNSTDAHRNCRRQSKLIEKQPISLEDSVFEQNKSAQPESVINYFTIDNKNQDWQYFSGPEKDPKLVSFLEAVNKKDALVKHYSEKQRPVRNKNDSDYPTATDTDQRSSSCSELKGTTMNKKQEENTRKRLSLKNEEASPEKTLVRAEKDFNHFTVKKKEECLSLSFGFIALPIKKRRPFFEGQNNSIELKGTATQIERQSVSSEVHISNYQSTPMKNNGRGGQNSLGFNDHPIKINSSEEQLSGTQKSHPMENGFVTTTVTSPERSGQSSLGSNNVHMNENLNEVRRAPPEQPQEPDEPEESEEQEPVRPEQQNIEIPEGGGVLTEPR